MAIRGRDSLTPERRSWNMSRIRSKNTKPELIVRKKLFSLGFRYRLHVKDLPGKPDIVLPRYKTVVFIHGCFWHGHEGCKYFNIPNTHSKWWHSKISANKKRDLINQQKLCDANWRVINIYSCQLKKNSLQKSIDNLSHTLRKQGAAIHL
jgi:DNA mismatch endonuclease (patch repair protein)